MLRRVAMAVLGAALPCAAFYSRRAAILLMPLGAILLFLATVIDPAEPIGRRMRDYLRSPGLPALAGVTLWAGASIAWAPFPDLAIDRFLNVAGLLAAAAAALAAMPQRMRAPSLYLLPIGAFAAVVVACVVAIEGRGVVGFGAADPSDPGFATRGGAALLLMTPVSLGWLMSRGRASEALALAVSVACAMFVLGDSMALVLLVGTVAIFAAARVAPRPAASAFAVIACALILGAPLFPLLAERAADLFGLGESFRTGRWADAISREGLRMIAGHGLQSAPRAIAAGIIPPSGSLPLIVALWYDLGLVGALGFAAWLWARAMRAAEQPADVGAAEIALGACALAQMCTGMAVMQAWWLSTFAAAVIVARAVAHGQFRTRRPRARLFGQR
jgi:hypothetical protein